MFWNQIENGVTTIWSTLDVVEHPRHALILKCGLILQLRYFMVKIGMFITFNEMVIAH